MILGKRAVSAVAVASLAGGLAVAGAAALLNDDPGERNAPLVDYSRSPRSHVTSVRGTPPQMLEALLRRPGVTRVMRAALGGPPIGFRGAEDDLPVPATARGYWVTSTVAAAGRGPAALRGVWEAELIAGALRDALHQHRVTALRGSEITLLLPDGRRVEHAYGGLGEVRHQQEFEDPAPAELDADIRSAFTDPALADLRLEVLQFDTIKVEQIAPVVIAATTSPKSAVDGLHRVVNRAFGLPPKYEGYYLEIRDSSGDPVVIRAASFRSGVGHDWFRPDLDPRAGSRGSVGG